jgi:hypothetical protein
MTLSRFDAMWRSLSPNEQAAIEQVIGLVVKHPAGEARERVVLQMMQAATVASGLASRMGKFARAFESLSEDDEG